MGERARLEHDARLTENRRSAGSAEYLRLACRRSTTGRPERFQNSAPFARSTGHSFRLRADSQWRRHRSPEFQWPRWRSRRQTRRRKKSCRYGSSPSLKRSLHSVLRIPQEVYPPWREIRCALTRSYPRHFTFYVARPTRSIQVSACQRFSFSAFQLFTFSDSFNLPSSSVRCQRSPRSTCACHVLRGFSVSAFQLFRVSVFQYLPIALTAHERSPSWSSDPRSFPANRPCTCPV